MKKKVISTRRFKAGYDVVKEEVSIHKEKPIIMNSAYNFDDKYIGDSRTAYRLCNLKGIRPEISHKGNEICSIGFSSKDKKWYGWSHRAIFGFGIGQKITNKVSGFSRLKEPFKIKTLVEAKKVAIKFADSVN